MSITIRQLEYLIAVAEEHSFTRAAASLYVSQPTLSQQLIQLEKTLQTKLLERTGRDIQLTEPGRVYFSHVVNALRELQKGSSALRELEDLSNGEIRVAMIPPAVMLIAPALTRFTELYPGIKLTLMEQDQEDIHGGLIDGDIDLGIGFGFGFGFGFGMLSDSTEERLGIEATGLWKQDITWLVGKGNIHYGRTAPLTPGDLQGARVVLLSRAFALRRYIDSYCQKHHIELEVSIEVNSIAMLIETVAGGALSTLCFEAFSNELRGLFSVGVVPKVGSGEIVVLRKRDRFESMACRAFLASIAH
ncbi:MAG: LysR substrate-binding domain-containing protein [Acidimicrobiales bacterium]